MKELLQRALGSEGCERLRDFVSVGPAQLAAVELFAERLLAAIAQQDEPVWIQPNHLQQARKAPFLCRVEPTQRMPDFVPLYTRPVINLPRSEVEALRKDAARYRYMQTHWSQLKAKFHPKTGDLHSITMVIVSDHSDAKGSPKLDSAIDSLMESGSNHEPT